MIAGACSGSPSVEEVVASTTHCSQVPVAPDLLMRLSSHAAYADSVRFLVVQACHRSGTACVPLLTTRASPAPVYSVAGKVLTVHLLGGNEPDIHRDRIDFRDSSYAVRVDRITGEVSPAVVAAFRRQIRHRCPSANQPYPDA